MSAFIKVRCNLCGASFLKMKAQCAVRKGNYCCKEHYWKSLKGKMPSNIEDFKTFGKKFGKENGRKRIGIPSKKKGIKTGLITKSVFKRGNIPWNKGIKDTSIQDGEHPGWKGKNAGYGAKHSWIYRKLGKANRCEDCGLREVPVGYKRYFQWANISQEYRRETSDYRQLCIKCHVLFDKQFKIIKHKICSVCRMGFDAKVIFAKYCSKKCSNKYWSKKLIT